MKLQSYRIPELSSSIPHGTAALAAALGASFETGSPSRALVPASSRSRTSAGLRICKGQLIHGRLAFRWHCKVRKTTADGGEPDAILVRISAPLDLLRTPRMASCNHGGRGIVITDSLSVSPFSLLRDMHGAPGRKIIHRLSALAVFRAREILNALVLTNQNRFSWLVLFLTAEAERVHGKGP